MSDIERVKKLIDWLIFERIVTSRKALAELLGYTESSLSQILNSKVALSDKFIKKLYKVDDRINIDWILTGEGNMLKSSQSNINGDNINGKNVTVYKQEIDKLLDLLLENQSQLSTAQAHITKGQEQMDRMLTMLEKQNQ